MDIFEACRVGDLDRVNSLIRVEGFDVNIEKASHEARDFNITPLGVAAKNGHLEIVKLLLESGASFDDEYCNFSALSLAAECGHLEIVEELLKAGADVNDEYYYSSPLACAARCENLEIVKLLLRNGADVNFITDGYPDAWMGALDYGIDSNVLKILKVLIEAGLDVNNKYHDTPILHREVELGNIEVVKLLIEAGADVNSLSPHGNDALYLAVLYGELDILDLLFSLPNEKFDHSEFSKRLFLEFANYPHHQEKGRWRPTRDDLSNAIKIILQHPNFPKDFDCGGIKEFARSVDEIYVGNEAIKSVVGSLYGSDRQNINLPLLEYLLQRQKKAGANLVEVLNESETFDQYFDHAELEDRSGIDYGATQETLFVTACAKGRADVAGLLHRYGADPKIKVMGRSAFALTLLQANNDFLALHERLQSQPTGEAGEATDTDEVVEISSPEQIIAKYLPSLSLILSVDHSFNPFDSEQNLPFDCENSYDFMQQLKEWGLNILDPLLEEHVVLKEYVLSSEKEKEQAEKIQELQGLVGKLAQGRFGEASSDESAGHGAPKRSLSLGSAAEQAGKFQRIR